VHVNCRECAARILVSGRSRGSSSASGVRLEGNVSIGGGAISFGPGGKLSFGPGGSVGFGPPRPSTFVCRICGHSAQYTSDEIYDD
jgi:hypothetical protein